MRSFACALVALEVLFFTSLPARADDFPSANREAFMSACLKTSHDNKNGCTCILGNLEKAVSFHDYVVWKTAMQLKAPVDQAISDRIVGAIAACRK